MRNGWKWSFVGTAALLCAIVAQVLLLYSQLVFIMPRNVEAYSQLGIEAPGYLLTTLRITSFIFDGPSGLTLLTVFVAGWALFEYRSTSDNKAVIRLAAGGTIALLVAVALWAVTFATVVPLAQTASLFFLQDPQPVAAAALSDAETAMAGVSAAVRAGDWPAAKQASSNLRTALDTLRYRRSQSALVAMKTPADVEKVRRLLDDLAQAAHDMHTSVNLSFQPEYQIPRANNRFRELNKVWQSFCKAVPCESTDTVPQPTP